MGFARYAPFVYGLLIAVFAVNFVAAAIAVVSSGGIAPTGTPSRWAR